MADDVKQARGFGVTRILAYAVELVSVAGVIAFLIAVAVNSAVFAEWNLNFLQLATISDVVMSGLDIFFAVLGTLVVMALSVTVGFILRKRLSYAAAMMTGILIASGIGASLASGLAIQDYRAELDRRAASPESALIASALDDLVQLDAAPFLYAQAASDPQRVQDSLFDEDLRAAFEAAREEWERTGVIPPEVVQQFRPDPTAMQQLALELNSFNIWAAVSAMYNAALLATTVLILFVAPYLVTRAMQFQNYGRRAGSAALYLITAFQFLVVGYYAFTVFEFRIGQFQQDGFIRQQLVDGCPVDHDPELVEAYGEDILGPEEAQVMWIGERAMVVRCGWNSLRVRLHDGGVWIHKWNVRN